MTASPLSLAYGVSKAGVAHLASCLADDMAGEGIWVNCVAPGLIRSFTSTLKPGENGLEKAGFAIPLKRIGEPEDIAGAVIFLASKAGSYVTGSTIPVNGGRTWLSQANQTSALWSIVNKPADR